MLNYLCFLHCHCYLSHFTGGMQNVSRFNFSLNKMQQFYMFSNCYHCYFFHCTRGVAKWYISHFVYLLPLLIIWLNSIFLLREGCTGYLSWGTKAAVPLISKTLMLILILFMSLQEQSQWPYGSHLNSELTPPDVSHYNLNQI